MRVLLTTVVDKVQEIVRLDNSDQEDCADMPWMIEKSRVILLLLVQIELISTPHDLGSQVDHLVMALLLVVWGISNLIFPVVAIIELASAELREHVLKPDAVQSDAPNLYFEGLCLTEVGSSVDILVKIFLEDKLSPTINHLRVISSFFGVAFWNQKWPEDGRDRLR